MQVKKIKKKLLNNGNSSSKFNFSSEACRVTLKIHLNITNRNIDVYSIYCSSFWLAISQCSGKVYGSDRWRSGESACLRPTWHGFNFGLLREMGWVCCWFSPFPSRIPLVSDPTRRPPDGFPAIVPTDREPGTASFAFSGGFSTAGILTSTKANTHSTRKTIC